MKGQAFQRSILEPPHEGRFRATAVTLKVLLHFAYGVEDGQIEGAPPWANSVLYDVNAKADEQVDALLKKMPEAEAVRAKQHMLQQLLVSRFQLKVHPVTREGSVYVLELARGGLKIKPDKVEGQEETSPEASKPRMHMSGQSMMFEHILFEDFARILSEMTHQKIVNGTGVAGTYTFALDFQSGGPRGPVAEGDSPFQSVEDGLHNQVGVKIAMRKGEVASLIVDRVEQPSAN